MPIASFGKKVFQVSSSKKYTFDGLSWGGGLDTEAQEKLSSKPSTYIKGSALDTLSFEVPLRLDFGHDVRAEIESWEALKLSASPDIFILGTKPLGKNKWLLKSVSVSDTEIDGNGRILKATLKLEFEEYVRAGSKPPEKGAGSASAIAGASNLNIAPNQYAFNPLDKSSQKRTNKNVEMAMKAGFYSNVRGLV